MPLTAPWRGQMAAVPSAAKPAAGPKPGAGKPADKTGATVQEAVEKSPGRPAADSRGNRPNGAAPGPAAAAAGTGNRPAALAEARGGNPDDLKQIKGVGPKLEALLNRLGFWHFDQVAAWTAAEVAWVDDNLVGFKGRVSRDGWVDQAKILAAGGQTEFSKRAKY